MRNTRTAAPTKVLALLLALALSLSLLAGCSNAGDSSSDAGSGSKAEGVKSITFTVVHGDGTSKDFPIETSQEMLGAALLDEKLIEGDEGEYGLFVTTVDGETADSSQQQWWCLTAGGETVTTGVDSTPIEDGGQYEFTLTTGY